MTERWKETGLRLTVFIAIAEESGDVWLVDALLASKDKLHREWFCSRSGAPDWRADETDLPGGFVKCTALTE